MKIRAHGAALVLTLAVLAACCTAARGEAFIKEFNGKIVGSYDDRFIKDTTGKIVGSYDDRFIKSITGKILGTYDDMFIKDITGKILGRHDGGKGRAAAGGLLLLLRECASREKFPFGEGSAPGAVPV